MKKLLLLIPSVFILLLQTTYATCPAGKHEIIIQIIPDSWPQETTWDMADSTGNIFASGGSVGDTLCVDTGACVMFTIHDSYGDGIYQPGGYWVYVDNVLIASGNSFGTVAHHPLACPPGTFCSSPLLITYGTYTAPYDNSWYQFQPTITGQYNITTCGLNTCNTKIWVYTTCNGVLNDETPAGTYAYNDDATCGLQASLDVVFIAGQTYYIRIGDSFDDCTGPEDFTFSYTGPVTGCTDPTACNFNPLATVSNGSCIYYPNPGCSGPDLELDSLSFVQSMYLQTTTAASCDVNEGCVTGYGTRYVISFTSKINNIGTLDYYIGNPAGNPNMFNTVNCHGHAHYEGYGDYRLFDMNGHLVPAGHKNGFCVMDLCGFGQYNCSDMGISVGCYDAYGAGTQCQWIDITDVPDGDYRLAALINSHHLPDALGHAEINYVNNALQVCIHIQHNVSGIASYSLLPSCTPYTDCLGIPGGTAMPDCNGICNGPGVFGDLNGNSVLDSNDVMIFADDVESSFFSTPCTDLSGDTLITVYDAALANWCLHTPHHPHPAGTDYNPCNFPHAIFNPNDSAGLAITSVNFANNYIDVELMSADADVAAYQFKVHGVTVSSVVSLASPADFPCDIRFVSGTNEVFALSQQDSMLMRSNTAKPICRIYFSAITDTTICVESIREIINKNAERTFTYIYGPCFNTLTTSIPVVQKLPVTLIPNPVTNSALLVLPHNEKLQNIKVIDVTGRITFVGFKPGKNMTYEIDFSGLQPGLYILKVESSSASGVVRFSMM